MVPRPASWDSIDVKNATRSLPRLVLALALAAAAVAWIPQDKVKRKMRMADAGPGRPAASAIA
jgi:hypothetical protein